MRLYRSRRHFGHVLVVLAAGVGQACGAGTAGVGDPADHPRHPHNHSRHDRNRPQPPKVDPGPAGPPVPPPSDAIVLFDGTGFDHWQHPDGSEVQWRLDDDAMQVVPDSGHIQTRRAFGDVQLHLEFRTDPQSPGKGQKRSNSGLFFGPYEIQVLDSYDNVTYPDGMAAAIYGQYPPLVNASRPAGQWQTYDVIYRNPRFDDRGRLVLPAIITLLHNGVLVQDHEVLVGPTSGPMQMPYMVHGDVQIMLQDHRDDPIHFRNIWVRELPPLPIPSPADEKP